LLCTLYKYCKTRYLSLARVASSRTAVACSGIMVTNPFSCDRMSPCDPGWTYGMIKVVSDETTPWCVEVAYKVEYAAVVGDKSQTRIKVILDLDPI